MSVVPVILSGRQAFDPRATLFAHNEPGVWYDFTDLSTMFTTSDGTTPVTAVEQAVGLILDKSKGLVLGPELYTGGTATGAAQTAITGGWEVWRAVGAVGSVALATLQAEKTYRVSLTLASRGSDLRAIDIRIPTGTGQQGYLSLSPAAGSYTFFVRTGNAASALSLTQPDVGYGGLYTNISVREIAGTHAIQASSASRPVLRNRYNQLTWSEDFSNAAWVVSTGGTGVTATKTPNFGIAPDGTQTACRVQLDKGAGTTDSDFARMFQSTSLSSVRRRVWIKTNDASTKTFRLEATGANLTVTGTWTQISDAASASSLQILLQGTTSNSADFLVWHPEVVYSQDFNFPYQRINAATDYDSDTTKFPLYLAFDGSDDSLYTAANLDLSGTDKVTVFAGVTKLSDAARGSIVESGASYAAGGTFGVLAANLAGANYQFGMSGSTSGTVDETVAGFASPHSAVLTVQMDMAGATRPAELSPRVNGVGSSGAAGSDCVGNFGNVPLYIGRRNNASVPYNGRIQQLIVRGAQSSAAEIASTERYVAGKQGRAL
jgi:hypothetical protein